MTWSLQNNKMSPFTPLGLQRPERSDPWGHADGEEEFWVGRWKGRGTLNFVLDLVFFFIKMCFKLFAFNQMCYPFS